MSLEEGRTIFAPRHDRADVIVVGSGAGGAVAAERFASSGLDVIVLEEGPFIPQSTYGALSPSDSLRRLAREGGLGAAFGIGETPFISLLTGKVVGGSSVMTGGVCFRVPEGVHQRWANELGLSTLSLESLTPFYDEVERRIHVETVPREMRSRSTELFVQGAKSLGITMKSLRRNTKDCRGASRCTFGCPNGAKMSVDVSYLPGAMQKGARLYSDARVKKLDIAGGRVRGVKGVFRNEEGNDVSFELRAKVVVLACGSLHTPLLLKDAGIGGTHVGKHLTLHPSFRVGAIFDEVVDGWDGSLQSVYSDHFHDDGITLVGVYSPINILAAAFPGSGKAFQGLLQESKHLAVFGGMVHDEGGGVVRRSLGREPLVTYKMAKDDRLHLFEGLRILGKMAFAAGAKSVLLPVFGVEPFGSLKSLEEFLDHPPHARRVECLAFHPLGSVRMGKDEASGVVDQRGEVFGVRNLFVTDGSILPTSIGVNSQVPIMSIAASLTARIASDWASLSRSS